MGGEHVPSPEALRARYDRLATELDAVDTARHAAVGDLYDAMVGTGAHRPLEDLDEESARLAERERTTLDELRLVAATLARAGHPVPVPGPRRGSPTASFPGPRRWYDPPAGGSSTIPAR